VNSARFTQVYVCIFAIAVISTLTNLNVSQEILTIGLAIAVTILGLPHGALDFAVAKSLRLFTSLTSACLFLFAYVIIALISIWFWIGFPTAGLVLFLSVSVYHFAADWRGEMPDYARYCMASIILCGPAIIYSPILLSIFSALLLPAYMAQKVVVAMQVIFGVGSIGLLIYLVPSLYRLQTSKGQQRLNQQFVQSNLSIWRVVEYTALLLSSLFLSPLLHFVLYFCVLHSPKHMRDVGNKLNVRFARLVVLSLPFVVVTMLLAATLYVWLGSANLGTDLLRWVFIGLFGLTMSHMLLVSVWHHRE
jgi:Brp/Blh family beta-carotene 15,15'-monooxygenase